MKKKSGCASWVLALAIVLGVTLGLEVIGKRVDMWRFPWAYAESGRPTLTGTWVGQATTGDLPKVTLRDIYTALGSPSLLAMGNRTEMPGCLVEQAVNAALDQTFHDAEALLLARLGEVTLAMLSADFHRRLVARGGSNDLETAHAS